MQCPLSSRRVEDLRRAHSGCASCLQEKAKIQNDIQVLSRRLAQLNESLARKIASRNEYDKVIQVRTPWVPLSAAGAQHSICPCGSGTARGFRSPQETESAYMKILESSQTLLTVLKRETGEAICCHRAWREPLQGFRAVRGAERVANTAPASSAVNISRRKQASS